MIVLYLSFLLAGFFSLAWWLAPHAHRFHCAAAAHTASANTNSPETSGRRDPVVRLQHRTRAAVALVFSLSAVLTAVRFEGSWMLLAALIWLVAALGMAWADWDTGMISDVYAFGAVASRLAVLAILGARASAWLPVMVALGHGVMLLALALPVASAGRWCVNQWYRRTGRAPVDAVIGAGDIVWLIATATWGGMIGAVGTLVLASVITLLSVGVRAGWRTLSTAARRDREMDRTGLMTICAEPHLLDVPAIRFGPGLAIASWLIVLGIGPYWPGMSGLGI